MAKHFEISPTLDRDANRSPGMLAAKREVAERIVERAKSAAPVGDPTTDPHSGDYRDSIHTEVHVHSNGEPQVQVVADSDHAIDVEFGNSKIPAHATLRRAAHG